MVRYPEHVQFRAPIGFTDAIAAAAASHGEGYADFIRQAVAQRLAASSAQPEQRGA